MIVNINTPFPESQKLIVSKILKKKRRKKEKKEYFHKALFMLS